MVKFATSTRKTARFKNPNTKRYCSGECTKRKRHCVGSYAKANAQVTSHLPMQQKSLAKEPKLKAKLKLTKSHISKGEAGG